MSASGEERKNERMGNPSNSFSPTSEEIPLSNLGIFIFLRKQFSIFGVI
jgi:hypothetical protein